jgi:H+/Cl- antiporter ClcA
MPFRWNIREQFLLVVFFLRWLLIAGVAGVLIGVAVAIFLWLLDWATHARWDHPWLLYLLPVAGACIGLMYHRLGGDSSRGNNLIVEQIHKPGGGVPARMAPLVLIGTIATHLFGGSAGREGTAVQMGGSIAGTLSRWFRMEAEDTRLLLMGGIAGGFGAVFGTPLTGAVFAIEVLVIGRMSYEALIPCLVASVIGDGSASWVMDRMHIHHTGYHIAAAVQSVPHLDVWMLGKVAVASTGFGLAGALFAELTHACGWAFKKLSPSPVVQPFLGGVMVILMVLLLGTRDYLGIGVTPDHPGAVCIVNCFHPGGAGPLSWWWKILFTAVTLGAGFKGGEVTPLFFIGAALGNTLAGWLHAPVDLFAGLGFVAVFAGATNTPLACTMMAIELFAPGNGQLLSSGFVVYAAEACCLAYLFSGHTGIYSSQRIGMAKLRDHPATGATLQEARHT